MLGLGRRLARGRGVDADYWVVMWDEDMWCLELVVIGGMCYFVGFRGILRGRG